MDKNYILHKYLNGEASEEEVRILREDPEFASYVKIARATSEYEVPGYQGVSNMEKIEEKISSAPKVRNLYSWKAVMRVAAIVAIAALSYVFLTNRDTKISTDIAQKETLLLPDNSEVILNAQSEIAFNKKNWDNKRSLELDGEAYFKVAKGKKFDVNTSLGTVSVLGTQFNVFARGDQLYVKCFEGLVSVAYADTLVKVPAGNYMKVENNRLLAYESTAEAEPSWIAFESRFENAYLQSVLAELMRQYPIQINLEDNTAARYTGSFTHKDLNVALRSICEPLQLEYKITGDQVTLYARNSR